MRIYKEYRKRLRKNVWCFDGYVERVRLRDSGFETRGEAEAAVASLRLRARNAKYGLASPDDPVTLAELVAERVRDLNPTEKKNDRRVRVVLETFRDYYPALQLVAALSDADLLAFKRARLDDFRRANGREMSPNSINRELQAVAALMNRAGQYFDALKNWKHPRVPYERTGGAGRERVINQEEIERLLNELRRDRRPGEQHLAHVTRLTVADLFEVALATGMRRGELRGLQREWIDWTAGLIQLPRHVTKTRRAREVPLNATAAAILRRRLDARPEAHYVFTSSGGTGPLGEFQMYRAIRNAAKAAGLDYGQRGVGGFTLHDARHTAATRMLHRGADLATVADVLGHSRETMTLRYAHATLDSKRRAVASLE